MSFSVQEKNGDILLSSSLDRFLVHDRWLESLRSAYTSGTRDKFCALQARSLVHVGLALSLSNLIRSRPAIHRNLVHNAARLSENPLSSMLGVTIPGIVEVGVIELC